MNARLGRPRLVLWTVAALTAAGMLLRAPRLAESLWYDEVAAWGVHATRGPGAITTSFAEPSNHIAHTLLSWCSVEILGDVLGFELSLRLPALLFSLAAIAAMAGLAGEVLGRRPAVLAAGLMAVLPVSVLEGAEARGYSMMICFSALASWTLLANLRRERAWRWVLYAALCAAGVWAHFVTALLPIGHAIWLGWCAARGRNRAFAVRGGVALAAAAVVAIALYAPALPDLLAARGLYVAARGGEPRVFGVQGWQVLLQLGGSWYAWAAAPGLALAALGAVAAARAQGPPPTLRDAAAVTLLGLPVLLLAVLLAGSWMYARFALFSLPGAVLLMAAGLDGVWVRSRTAGLAACVLVVVASMADLTVRPARQPLRDAATLVRERLGADESILVIGLAHRVIDVYLGDLDPQYSLMHGVDLEQRLAARPDWIVLYYPSSVSETNYELLEARGYKPVERFPGWMDRGNGDVVVLKRAIDL